MSNIKLQGEENKDEEFEHMQPKSKTRNILQELEVLALQKGSNRNSFDTSKLSQDQMNKFLEILQSNEDNAYKFHTKRLEAIERIQIKKIESTTINQKTIRYGIISVLIGLPVLTILILLFKENFFIPWLTFLTGLGGGIGISNAFKSLFKEPQLTDPISEEREG